MTEYGALGIFFWLMMYFNVFRMVFEARRSALQLRDHYFYYRLVAVSVALTACLIAALFTDRLYSEGIYWIMALAMAMHRLVRAELADASVETGVPARAA
jgi:hypothetical protein